MAILTLRNGIKVLIDDEDLPRVSKYNWIANPHRESGKYYITRTYVQGDKQRYLSRFIMNLTDPNLVVDYINKNTLDNRKVNLRVSSQRQNRQHGLIFRKEKTSKYPGVSWRPDTQKWFARITICGKNKHLGSFLNERDAAKAYETAVRKLAGEELFCKMKKDE